MRKKIISVGLSLAMTFSVLPTTLIAAKSNSGNGDVYHLDGKLFKTGKEITLSSSLEKELSLHSSKYLYKYNNNLYRITDAEASYLEAGQQQSEMGSFLEEKKPVITGSEELAEVVKAAEAAIDKLPEEITLEDKEVVELARGLVEKVLIIDQDLVIKGLDKLEAAEHKISELEQVSTDYGYWFINNGKEVEIMAYFGDAKEVVIPDEIENKPVTSIGNRAFTHSQLTSIEIPSGVTSIGEFAFSYNNLKSIEIPSSVTHIGYGSFISNQKNSKDFIIFGQKESRVESYAGEFKHNFKPVIK